MRLEARPYSAAAVLAGWEAVAARDTKVRTDPWPSMKKAMVLSNSTRAAGVHLNC